MKSRVVKEYIDKHTQEFHAVGDMVSLTDERFAEITGVGRYVEEVKPDEEPVEPTERPDDDPDQNLADQEAVDRTADQEAKEQKVAQEPMEKAVDSEDSESTELANPIKQPKKPRRNKKVEKRG